MRKMILYRVHHGTGVHTNTIYACAKDAETGECEISATLDYVLAAAKTRKWVWVLE